MHTSLVSYHLKKNKYLENKGRIGTPLPIEKKNKSSGGTAIVTSIPGTTRDRRECYGRIGGTIFRMVDTAGVDGERIGHLAKQHPTHAEKSMERSMMEQTVEAAKAADLILLMLDAKVGVTTDLMETARWLRKIRKDPKTAQRVWSEEPQHVMLLANKLEGDHWQHDDNSPVMDHLLEATRVGFGEAVPISAEHGEGMIDIAGMIDDLSARKRKALGYIDDDDEQDKDKKLKHSDGKKPTTINEPTNEGDRNQPLQLAILGRPNVGKSTLVNALLGHERVITGSTPGLTRDAILVEWSWKGRPVQLVDTAGIRKITKRANEIEDMAVQDANRAMKVADVAVLVLDAQAGNLQRQELAIADAVVKEGRALVIAANKMDLIVRDGTHARRDGRDDDNANDEDPVININNEKEEELGEYTPRQFAKQVSEEVEIRLPMLRKTPVIPMSSLSGENVEKLMPVVFKARDRWERTIPTGLLNRWLIEVQDAHPPPPMEGRNSTKIKYIIQTKGRPPTFLLFANVSDLPPQYMRHLRRNLQDSFNMFGMEVRFSIKRSATSNPYEPKGNRRGGSGLGGHEARKKRVVNALKATGAPPPKRKKRRRKFR